MIKVIVFDLWDTIAHHIHKSGSLKGICKECYTSNFRNFLKNYEQIFQVSKNVSFEQGFRELFDYLKIKYDDKKIKKYAAKRKKYESTFMFYNYITDLLNDLKNKGYKVALLSNTSSYLGEKIKKSKVGMNFDKLFFSYEIGAIKPGTKVFKEVLNHFKIKPSEALMIGDDYLDDYKASRKIGMKSIHFKNGKQLKKGLKRMKVL